MIEVPAHIDDRTIAQVAAIGPLVGIIASHPDMYGLQSLWSEAFDQCPVYISAPDEHWLGHRPANTIVWDGELRLSEDLVASQPGGHFPGSMVATGPAVTTRACCSPETRLPQHPPPGG